MDAEAMIRPGPRYLNHPQRAARLQIFGRSRHFQLGEVFDGIARVNTAHAQQLLAQTELGVSVAGIGWHPTVVDIDHIQCL